MFAIVQSLQEEPNSSRDEETSRLNPRSPQNGYGAAAEPEGPSNEEDPAAPDRSEPTEEEAIASLTRRLRCLFAVITWPIVPLGTIVTLALLYLVYAAFILDARKTCAHPLHWYVVISLLLIAYAPNHTRIRRHVFHYVRERDGPTRPPPVRRFDQFFHTLALLYVYGGITLVQTCREDMHKIDEDSMVNSCTATCPNLYPALSVYVATLELFTFSLILPLLFLPCIYLWFLRQATADAEALAVLQDRLREEEALFRNGGVTAEEILSHLEAVKLVADDDNNRVLIVPLQSDDPTSEAKDANGVKECCICMCDFVIADLETGDASSAENNQAEAIVRTQRCGHLFHKQCIASWVGGRWQNDEGADGSPRRRARRTTCPLCRQDLRTSY